MTNRYRNAYAEIDLEAIHHNLTVIKENLQSGNEVIPVLKANAYGHGSVEIAKYIVEKGVNILAVTLLEEAMELRENGVTSPIIVLGWVSPAYAHIAAENNLVLTVFQKNWLKRVNELGLLKTNLSIHVKFDTGMGRNGIRSNEELSGFTNEALKSNNIEITGVFTHFATSDNEDATYFNEQINRFEGLFSCLTTFVEESQLMVHIGNSAASLQHPKQMTHYSRVGVSMYGMYPSADVKKAVDVKLKPALTLRSELIHVKKVKLGDKISYGGTYEVSADEWIGTVAFGYGDGWVRKLQGSYVLVEGKRMQIVGRICMDMFMIKLDKEYEVTTPVTMIGADHDAFISVDEVAEYIDTINYEVTTLLTNRVPRVYIR